MKFTNAGYFWAMLLPAILIIIFIIFRFRKNKVAIKYANTDLFETIVSGKRQTNLKKIIPSILFILAFIVLIIGVSGPTVNKRTTSKQNHIIIVLDVSNSMEESDIKPTRLEAAKSSIKDFVGSINGSPLFSVITFSADVHIDIKSTRNKSDVIRAIQKADYEGGTAVGDATQAALELGENILLASEKVKDLSDKSKTKGKTSTIVLLTDGDTVAGRPLIETKDYASETNSAIYAIAMIPKVGGVTASGTITQESQDEMKAVAKATGGEYFQASNSDSLKEAYKKTTGSLKGNKVEVSYEGTFVFWGLLLLSCAAITSKVWSNKLI